MILASRRPRLPMGGAVNPPGAVAEAHTLAVTSTEPADVYSVTVLEELPRVHAIQHDILFAALAHFEQTASLARLGPADGSRAQQVASPHGTPTERVMGNHLRKRPHEVFGAQARNGARVSLRRCQQSVLVHDFSFKCK